MIDNPYVGPRSFTGMDSDRYFGREVETRDLYSLFVSSRVLLFSAPSGAGKSSLIQAGLIPRLQQEGFEVLPIARVSGGLFDASDAAQNIFVANLISAIDPGSEKERFASMTLSHYLLEEYAGEQGDLANDVPPPRALIIDQFEELLTRYPEAWQQRADFFEQLRAALEDDPLLYVLLSVREDYVAAYDPFASRVPGGLRSRYSMQRMTAPGALRAIRRPASLANRPFADGVAEMIVDDLRRIRVLGLESMTAIGEFVEPVQLQVVCQQFWSKLPSDAHEISAADVQQAGTIDDSLRVYYENAITATIDSMSPQDRVSEGGIRDWFSNQLITQAGTRATVFRGEVESGGLPNEVVEYLAHQFLLREELRGGVVWYELVNDRFVDPILASNAAWREAQIVSNPVLAAAYAWESAVRDNDLLWSGQLLANTLEGTNLQDVDPVVDAFLRASQEAEQRRELERAAALEIRDRRQRRLIAVMIAVIIILLLTVLYLFSLI